MEFFLDTADVDEIREIAAWGILDGVTTNPSLIKKSGRDFKQVVREIAEICSGPISAEVTAMDTAGMVEQGVALKNELPPNVIIKVPCTPEGLAATKILTEKGIDTNVTLIFSASQALMAAKAGATYVSPFVGRIDDTGHDGMELIAQIMAAWDHYQPSTKVLAASIRHPTHVLQCMQLGAHTATMPAKIFRQLLQHPLTDKGIDSFMKDWADVEAAGNA
ncbi:MAG: fructose-6-phosphate aldolase [archaeon]|nr:fructose-6-phosphate aldolase [archaeon]MDA0842589.1 fructose-6-phosphate aldolase [archaeon]MDA1168687.1 fructose-6-phosphate aldolase [archaeon]